MDAEEREVCNYLKGFPGQFVHFKQVCRRAGGKKRFRKDHFWAIPVIKRLVEKKMVETDDENHCRLLRPGQLTESKRRWVSPQVMRILKAAGKGDDGVFVIPDPEEDEENEESEGAEGEKKEKR